jgi:hypothetical protein
MLSNNSLTNAFFQKNEHKILRSAQIIAQCYQQNGHLFAMGNSGSSCDAAHITALNPKEYDRWLNETLALCGCYLFLLLDIYPHCWILPFQ